MALRGVGRFHNHSLAGIGWRWWALVGAPPPLTPEKTALHTKSSQTAGLEAIWCEVLCKMPRNTPVWWLFRF
ncbi:hypothetical protein B1A61_02400 [Corynebacterium diphtheriae]|uniref:hypothetical protein n=1 Tax=Corynebacterium diphtheriae TaxID=1717 RepID=UPI000A1E27AC|nr:hypothetical protein [Corynebacterium diphtheriae]OSQ07705.1 hypothetical protein B1A61_02400 [Corynebacterium diphtheriae]